MWASPECKPWLCFVSRNNNGRDSARPGIVGDYNVEYINESNESALVLAWMMSQCTVRSVHTGLEQPLNSLLLKWPVVQNIFEATEATRIVCNAGALGAESLKPLEFMVTHPEAVARKYLDRNRRCKIDTKKRKKKERKNKQ